MNGLYTFLVFFYFSIALPEVTLAKGQLFEVTEDNWSDILNGEWMVEFYAPWCPACQQLKPLWKDFAEWSDDLSIKVANIDVTVNPGLSGRFMITALPTIFHVKKGVFRQYRGSRDKDAFISFVEERKWQNIDPVPGWKAPQSLQMSMVSTFFKLSMLLRNIHNSLIDDYGIPYWGSYIIFGLLTVLVGAILGLLVVCIIDFFCPSRMGYQAVPKDPNADEKRDESDVNYEGEEDVIRGDIPDDLELRRRRDGTSNE